MSKVTWVNFYTERGKIEGEGAEHDYLVARTKGVLGGLCNRSACLAPGANWWNPNTLAHYCCICARKINQSVPRSNPEWRLVPKSVRLL